MKQRNVENVIAAYGKKYIRCGACKGFRTHLTKTPRLQRLTLVCTECGAQKQVKTLPRRAEFLCKTRYKLTKIP